jgi:hypothetical protein
LLRDICNGSDDGGLSYHAFKAMVAIKLLNLYSSQDVSNVHYFKKELKTKYEATKAICGKFPFGTAILEHVLVHNPTNGAATNTLAKFYGMTADLQAPWERLYDDLALAMLFLNNSRNEEAKKELRRSYANGNASAYQITLEKMARLLSSQYPMTKGQNKKPPYKNNDGNKTKGKGSDTDSNKDDSGNLLAGAHTTDGAKNTSSTKSASKSTPSSTVGAHISDSEEYDHPATSRSVQELLASHPINDPIWGDQDYTDDYSVDTEDSAQALAGFHAYEEEDRIDDEEIPTIDDDDTFYEEEIDAETARLIALDQQRLDELFVPDMEAYFAIEKCSDTVQPEDKSELLQNMDNLDVVVLVTSTIDCDLESNVPQELDFQVGQH